MGQFKEGYDDDVLLEDDEEIEIKKPNMYKVLFHNDDYTTMEFVVFVLQHIFHKSEAESTRIMYEVHNKGVAVVGIYTYEVASTNIHLVESLKEEFEYPLLITMEKID